MDNLRGLLGIRRMDRVLNALIRELCGVTKGVDEKGLTKVFSDGSGMWKKKENDRIAKRVFVGECAGSHSVSRPWKRWIDTVKEC